MQARFSVLLLAALQVAGSLAACPASYTDIGLGMCVTVNSLVQSHDGRLPWAKTDELCKAEGGRLVSLDTPEKLQLLSAHIYGSNQDLDSLPFWVGVSKEASGWQWLNSAPLPQESHMWLPDEPKEEETRVYAQIVPFSQVKRHYIMTLYAEDIAPGYVCEADSTEV